jgi:uncharacterized coiled-coil protein SlyX
MATLEERVAYLEGQTADHTSAISELKLDVRELRTEMNRRFDHAKSRFDHIDTKFMWLVRFQFTTLIAAIASLLNGYFR